MSLVDDVRNVLTSALPQEDVALWMQSLEKAPESCLKYYLDLFRDNHVLLRDCTDVLKCRMEGMDDPSKLAALPWLEEKTLARALV